MHGPLNVKFETVIVLPITVTVTVTINIILPWHQMSQCRG